MVRNRCLSCTCSIAQRENTLRDILVYINRWQVERRNLHASTVSVIWVKAFCLTGYLMSHGGDTPF